MKVITEVIHTSGRVENIVSNTAQKHARLVSDLLKMKEFGAVQGFASKTEKDK